jgi:hypothetical protein
MPSPCDDEEGEAWVDILLDAAGILLSSLSSLSSSYSLEDQAVQRQYTPFSEEIVDERQRYWQVMILGYRQGNY